MILDQAPLSALDLDFRRLNEIFQARWEGRGKFSGQETDQTDDMGCACRG